MKKTLIVIICATLFLGSSCKLKKEVLFINSIQRKVVFTDSLLSTCKINFNEDEAIILKTKEIDSIINASLLPKALGSKYLIYDISYSNGEKNIIKSSMPVNELDVFINVYGNLYGVKDANSNCDDETFLFEWWHDMNNYNIIIDSTSHK